MTDRFFLSVILGVLTLLGCSDNQPAPPFCRANDNLLAPREDQRHIEAVACVIKTQATVMLLTPVANDQQQLQLPKGELIDNSSAACSAHYHTWHLTGLNVDVRKQLLVTRHGVALFECQQNAGLNNYKNNTPVPSWSRQNNLKIVKLHPFEFENKALEDKDMLTPIRDAFVAIQN